MKRFTASLAPLLVFGYMFVAAAPAQASLIPLTNVQLTGQGIGAVLTVITLQTGQPTTESGMVNFNGTTTGDVQPGASQSTPFTLAQAGITGATLPSELAFVVNLAEPGSENPPSVMTTSPFAITLFVYSPTGTLLDTFSAASGLTLNQVAGGVGGSGIVFGFDALQAAEFNTLINGSAGTEVLTVGASFANAQGGNDVIQATRLQAIPEPASLLLLGTGLASAGASARRRLGKR